MMKFKIEMADVKSEDSLSNDDISDNNTTVSSYGVNQSQISVSKFSATISFSFRLLFQFSYFLIFFDIFCVEFPFRIKLFGQSIFTIAINNKMMKSASCG